MTLTKNTRKYWTLRKTGKQKPSRSQSTQKKTSIISMEYPSNCQISRNQYYEKAKQRKQPPKLQHQAESAKVCQRVWFCTGAHPKSTFRNTLEYFDPLQTHKYHTHTHTTCLGLPTKLCRWLSDFVVERVIQVKIESFLSPKVYPKAGVPQGPNLSLLLLLIYVNDMPNPSHHQTN